MNRRDVKKKHERVVLEKFIGWYNKENSCNFVLLDCPDPPDAIIQDSKYISWLEHADTYRSSEEAREEYDHVPHTEHPIINPDDRTAERLLNCLLNKLNKANYAKICEKYGRGVLVLTERDNLFSESTLDAIIELVQDYQQHVGFPQLYFREVYLLLFEKLNEAKLNIR